MADPLLDSWTRSLKARNRSLATIDSYLTDCGRTADWLATERDKTLIEATSRDLDAYLAACRDAGLSPATVARRYRSLLQFFKWAETEDEIDASPMLRMKPPKVEVQPPPVISPDEMNKLIQACRKPRPRPGRPRLSRPDRLSFENKRDTALILMLSTTGIRSGELMGLKVEDIDMTSETFTVMGKGGRARIVALMPKVANDLDRYLRERNRHPHKSLPWLWLGDRGRLTDSGLRQLLERRCEDAGIPPINPHRFRHTFAHEAKSRGMNDGDLMAVAGWKTPQMLHRYGASAAAERARDSHRRLFGDR